MGSPTTQRATAGDWGMYRELKKRSNHGWGTTFAEAQEGRDPHDVIHSHLTTIYSTGNVIPPMPPWDGPLQEFTRDELRFVLTQGKSGKAVATDGTSHELLVA